MKADLLSMTRPELRAFMATLNEPAYRADQLCGWLLRGAHFSEMSNLSKALRQRLEEAALANPVSIEAVHTSRRDETEKLLYRLADDHLIEGVLMRYHHGSTLCVSSQVGCRMGCRFCASTLEGRARDLSAGEMLGQVVAVNRRLAGGERVGNVVIMGSGEPLDNYDNTVRFLRLLLGEEGLNMSARAVSLSTCGLAPQMRAFAEEGLPITLSVSLHAPSDAIRRALMPAAGAHPIASVLDACRYYIEKTGRRVIFEYALIEGVNSDLQHADALAKLLRGMQCHVNLIPLNEVSERGLRPPSAAAVDAFLARLTALHISATRRREMGEDIQGACGQLRRRVLSREGT